MAHISVLMNEVIEGLDLQSSDIVVDATINGGGHSEAILKHLGAEGSLIGIDQDPVALAASEKRLSSSSVPIHLVCDNFRRLDQILEGLGIQEVDKILFDLGWSSNQFEDPSRGFSFMHDGPLDMLLSSQLGENSFRAADIINTWSEEHLIDILEAYGEEKYAWHIVQAILKAREDHEIDSTKELAEIIQAAVPPAYRRGKIHPATKTFQALRITVNDEMSALKEGLRHAWHALGSGGRIVVISFHSIEDRIVKNYFKSKKEEGSGLLLTKKPIIAGNEELLTNNRARSAKLRIIQKI